MKICLINNLYKPYDRGGAERVVEIMSEAYIKEGHEIIVITTKPYSNKISNFQFPISNENIKIFQIPGLYYNLSKLPLISRLTWHVWDMFDAVSCYRVKRILEKEKPDLIVTHNLKGIGYLIPGMIRKLEIEHYHYLHDIQLVYPSGLLYFGEEKKLDSAAAIFYQRICAQLLGSPNKVISPTNWLINLHQERGFFSNSKIEVKKSAIGDSILRTKDENGGFNFLFVGQVEKHKGVETLIEAFGGSKGNAELLIVGEGGFLASLKERAGQNSRIKFFGRKSREEVEKIMAVADCLVVPSLCYENAPAVIFEACRAGLPVIASRIGGIPELIEKCGGALFTPGDASELRRLMSRVQAGEKML
ncbi:MAG: glycosyltransferase [Patescibacteria group bacterium]|jgi:glycosyltransferase involved in cell wall biosynthesis